MVGGRQMLLSIAVLYGVGLNSVVEASARFRRQNGGSVNVIQSARAVGQVANSSVPISLPVSSVSSAPTPAKVPPIGPPGRVIASSPVSLQQDASTVVVFGNGAPATTAAGIVVKLTVESDLARSTSAVKEYVYPGVYGPDGTLTTESEAFSRSVLPTRASIGPNPGTGRAPPPVDAAPSSSSPSSFSTSIKGPPPLPTFPRPVVPVPDEIETEEVSFAFGTTSTQPPVVPPPIPGRPGGPAVIPTMSSVPLRSEGVTSFHFGKPETTASSFTGYHNSSVPYANQTQSAFASTTTPSLSFCQASDFTIPPTTWSVVYTSTITWYGNPEDYTPPYSPISTPDSGSTCVDPMSPPKFTISVCTSTGTGSKYVTCDVTTTTSSWAYGFQSTIRTPPSTITFVTTDKNPAVVYSAIKTPNYGVSQPPRTDAQYVSATDNGNPVSTPLYMSDNKPLPMSEPSPPPSRAPSSTPSPITIGIQPTAVVINDNTIRDNPAKPTQVVIVSGQTFTIDPTRVIGGGATIDRPAATGGGVFIPTPTTTSLDGLPVVMSSSVAVIGGSTFTFGPETTVAVVSGRTFTIGPTAIAVASHTVNLPTAPAPTEVVVVGGELVTAIGPSLVVIRGTTLTYGGTSTAVLMTTVDDDVITLGPGGVTVHGTITLGGPNARPSETGFAVAGGATITKVGASVIVIRSTTYTIGPGTGATTTVVGGETITIKPDGVVVSTLSMGYPFGPTTVILPGAGVTAASSTAAVTAIDGGEEEDAAGILRPGMMGATVGWAVIVGVLALWVG